jgi:hypothetical protein
MKQNHLIIIILFLAYSYANCQIITFSGKNARNDSPVTLDSVLIQNLTKHKDTVIKDNYFNLSGATGIGNVTLYSIPYSIEQNYPNSFDDGTRFAVNIPKSGTLSISLINYLGEVISCISNNISEGRHEFKLSGGNFPPGAYFIISSYNSEIKAIKIMKAGSSSNSPAKIEHIGNSNFEPMVFDAGDEYRFTGYSLGFDDLSIWNAYPNGGENYIFNFLGTKPEIDNFTPILGCIGQKVVISGYYFVPDIQATSVYFGDIKSTILLISGESITTRVPDGAKTNLIKVVCPFDEAVGKYKFYVYKPIIFNFSPLKGFPKDTVTINGDYFLPEKDSLIVKIGNVKTNVISVSTNKIKFIIPDSASTGIISISFFSEYIESSDSIKVPAHRIYSYTPIKGIAGTSVKIKGRNFGFDKNLIKVYFGTKESEITNIQDSIIETKVPDSLNVYKAIISLKKDGFNIISKDTFNVELSPFNFKDGEINIGGFNMVYHNEYIYNYYTDTVDTDSKIWNDTINANYILTLTNNPNFDGYRSCTTRDYNLSVKDTIIFWSTCCKSLDGGSLCYTMDTRVVIDSINHLFEKVTFKYSGYGKAYPKAGWDDQTINDNTEYIFENIPYIITNGKYIAEITAINFENAIKKLYYHYDSKYTHIFYSILSWDRYESKDLISYFNFSDSSYLRIVLNP